MATMRAVLIKDGKGPLENLYIGETNKPIPKAGEVLVKVGLPLGINRYISTYIAQLMLLTCI